MKGRTALEEAARDSFENVAFSLCRFHQLTGHYPDTYTVVRAASCPPDSPPSPIQPTRTPKRTHNPPPPPFLPSRIVAWPQLGAIAD